MAAILLLLTVLAPGPGVVRAHRSRHIVPGVRERTYRLGLRVRGADGGEALLSPLGTRLDGPGGPNGQSSPTIGPVPHSLPPFLLPFFSYYSTPQQNLKQKTKVRKIMYKKFEFKFKFESGM
uniref:Uncharacterized protein n=1 Tax=Oryza barthii TaxID=65489 RepID=A0A0D3FYX9_9ORYZ